MAVALVDLWYWWIDAFRELIGRFSAFKHKAVMRLTIEVNADEMLALHFDKSLNLSDGEPFPLLQLAPKISEIRRNAGDGRLMTTVLIAPRRFVLRQLSTLVLPRSKLKSAAALDLAIATPFKPEDVLILAIGQSEVRSAYAIVNKSVLDPVLMQLRAQNLNIDQLVFQTQDGVQTLASFEYRALSGQMRSFKSHAIKIVAAAFCFCLLVTTAHIWVRHKGAIDALNLQVEDLTLDAKAVRQMLDRRDAAKQELINFSKNFENSEVITGVWEELARLLPDSAYLTDLDIKGGNVTISGYAVQAASLVVALEQSDMFSKANFIAPVVKSPGQSGERFQISLTTGEAD